MISLLHMEEPAMAGNHEGDQEYMFTLMVCNPLVRWGVTEFEEEFGVLGVNSNQRVNSWPCMTIGLARSLTNPQIGNRYIYSPVHSTFSS